MSEPDAQSQVQAQACFERARQASEAGDFDRAIDAYLDGLRRTPDAVEHGHIELRVLALRRQERGGTKPSPQEAQQRLAQGHTPLDKMLNAEYLLARDPEHLAYGEALLRAAVEGNYRETAKWIADLMFLANNNARKPSVSLYILLKDSYEAVKLIERAVAACQRAARLRPDDIDLAVDLKRLMKRLAGRKRHGAGQSGAPAIHMGKPRPRRTRVKANDAPTPGDAAQPEPTVATGLAEDPNLVAARSFFDKARKYIDDANTQEALNDVGTLIQQEQGLAESTKSSLRTLWDARKRFLTKLGETKDAKS